MTVAEPVRATGVVAGYDGRVVVDGADLTVAAGEVVAILGANGSGKSTLIKSLVGLVPLDRGSIEVFGAPLADFHAWQRIGYVPQRVSAAAGVPATVEEVVRSGLAAHHGWWRPGSAASRRAVGDALVAVGLERLGHRSVTALSGGQQQRVLIARALVGRPALLVLDEPNAGVDAASQDVLASLLDRLSADGAAVVLVAHELGPLRPVIDRAVVMRGGRVAFDGRLDDVIAAALDSDHVHAHADPAPVSLWGLT